MFENLRLKASMIGSLAIIISITTVAAMVVLSIAGVSLIYTFAFIVPFFLLQWYLGPKLVERGYNVKEASKEKYPRLHEAVEELAQKSDIDKPQVMVADVDMPNAFAYGNHWTGDKVAVTKGLLNTLEWEEVEAVVGHEIGHLSHNDSTYMMFLSILPAIFMIVGRMFFWSSLFGGGGGDNQGQLPMIAIAAVSMLIYFVLQLGIMHFSRMREYYADKHSSEVVSEGNRKLAEGLAKINEGMKNIKDKQKKQRSAKGIRSSRRSSRGRRSNQFGGVGATGLAMKPLLISDPDTAEIEGSASGDLKLVKKYANKELSFGDRIKEFLSTHPNIKKRLKAMGF